MANEDCCTSSALTGGTFYRGYDGITYTNQSYPATVSDFRLDEYEITVGRFRRFVAAWNAGWRPGAGDGKHAHLNGGSGLSDTVGGYESGWDTAWAGNLAATKEASDPNLACDAAYQTWTTAVGDNENRPINCASACTRGRARRTRRPSIAATGYYASFGSMIACESPTTESTNNIGTESEDAMIASVERRAQKRGARPSPRPSASGSGSSG